MIESRFGKSKVKTGTAGSGECNPHFLEDILSISGLLWNS